MPVTDSETKSVSGFVLRIAPAGGDRVAEALRTNELIIGWSRASGLTDPNLSWEEFRQIVHNTYYAEDEHYRGSGRDAGKLWRFIRTMKQGDFVVVPHGPKFYVGEVKGAAYYGESKMQDDTAYRRPVKWLNEGKPIPRSFARAALQSRMKVRHACAYAEDLVEEIKNALELAKHGEVPPPPEDLYRHLVTEVSKEICRGRWDSYGFERLVARMLSSLGASDVKIIPRNLDKGADILARFSIASVSKITLAVQAKHHQPERPLGSQVIEQLAQGMEAEEVDLGWVVTSGTFSEEAVSYRDKVGLERGLKIELVDGEQFAAMLVESGLKLGKTT